MTKNAAIKLAIGAGYNTDFNTTEPDIFLDPNWWIALGKARGFKPTYSDNSVVTWRYWAQEWFHVKMSNGDETKFWQSLP